MSTSEWLSTKIAQIASLTSYDGGGKDITKIDSNTEFACLARLLANCETNENKQFVYNEMQEYLSAANKNHFEWEDGTSYDEIHDGTGNRMYIDYNSQGEMTSVHPTYINKEGYEVTDKENIIKIELPPEQNTKPQVSNTDESKVDEKGFFRKHSDNVKQFYSDLRSKGIKEAYSNYWSNIF